MTFDGTGTSTAPTFSANLNGGDGTGVGTMTVTSGQASGLTISNAGAAGLIFGLANDAGINVQSGAGAVDFGLGGAAFTLQLGSGAGGLHTASLVNDSANTATLESVVTITAGGSTTETADFGGAGNWLVNGAITGAVAVTKDGAGTLTLAGGNTYTGVTTINAGTLKAANASALGSNTSLVINAGGTFDVNGLNFSSKNVSLAGTITNSGASQSNALKNVTLTADAVWTGTVSTARFDTRSGTITLNGHTLTKNGPNETAIADETITAGNITVTAGTLALTRTTWASGTLTGATGGTILFENNSTGSYGMAIVLNAANLSVSGNNVNPTGTVSLTGTNTISVVAGMTLTLSGVVSGGGTLNFTNGLVGTLVLSNANTFTGGTVINNTVNAAAVVKVTNTAGTGTGAVTVNKGTLSLLNDGTGSNGTITYSANNVVINSGNTSTINVGNNGGASTGNTIVIGSTNFNLGNSTLNVTGSNGYQLKIAVLQTGGGAAGTATLNPTTANLIIGSYTNTTTRTVVLDGTSSGNVIQGVVANVGGVVTLTKSNTSTWELQGANTFTGGVNINGGTLLVNNVGATSGTGTGVVTINAGGTLGGIGRVAPTGANFISINGLIAPGTPATNNGVGTLTLATVTGNATFSATGGATLQLLTNGGNGLVVSFSDPSHVSGVTGAFNGTGGDRISFLSSNGGLLDFTSATAGSLNVVLGPGYAPAYGDAFDLLDWSTVTGLNVGLLTLPDLTSFNPGFTWDTSQFVSQGVIVVVPEPGRVLLVLMGLGAMVWRRGRRRGV